MVNVLRLELGLACFDFYTQLYNPREEPDSDVVLKERVLGKL